ncbi:FtsX-like permease family protein [Cellulosimicrobium terreum]|nr:FtsX-like permease family protein [Cellulosimicrobium terreum]
MNLARLTWRQFVAHRSVSVALAVLVLVVAFVVTAWPRAVAATNADQVAYELAGSTPLQRDVIAVSPTPPDLGPAEPAGSTGLPPEVEAVWGAFDQGLGALRDAQPAPLRTVLGSPGFTVEDDPQSLDTVPGNDVRHPSGSLKIDPHLPEHATLVDGAWPQGGSPLQVAVSAEAADVLGWPVGGTRVLGGGMPLVLSGTFTADDPAGDYWQHNPASAAPYVEDDLNLGLSARTALYVDPAAVEPYLMLSPSTRVWYPVSGDDIGAADVAPLLAQLRGFTAVPHPVVPDGSFQLAPASELTVVLTELLAQQQASSAILAVLAVGPLGVTVAVLLLGARLVVSRRRSSLALLRARGASGAQLRGLMAGEGLALGLPAAAVGAAAAVLAVPASAGGGPVAVATFAPALVAALAPAALFALTTSPGGLRETRADLRTVRGRLDGIVSLLVVAAAAVSVLLLLQRGVLVGTTTGPDGEPVAAEVGVDPLLAAAPLLLAVATALVVVRLAPWPVRALERVLRRRRDLVPFLGSARAVRDPAGGAVPALALVVGVSVALVSGVLYTTVRSGVEDRAWQSVGADLRVSGPIMDDDVVAQLEQVDGVDTVATVADLSDVVLRQGPSGERMTVLAVDGDALADVQGDVPGGLPAGLGTAGDRLPAVVSTATGVTLSSQDAELASAERAPIDVLAVRDEVPGLAAPRAFVVVDRTLAEDVFGTTLHPRLALLSLDDGADEAAVGEAVSEVLPQSVVTSPAQVAADTLGSPLAAGMNRAFVVAVALSGLLYAVAVVLALMIGAPARDRIVAVLRTLGLERRRTAGLVAWEIGPWALASLVVGSVLGLAIPALVLATVELTSLTGGDAQPSLAIDLGILGLVVGGFVLVVVAAVAVAAAVSRRANLAAALRIGEER